MYVTPNGCVSICPCSCLHSLLIHDKCLRQSVFTYLCVVDMVLAGQILKLVDLQQLTSSAAD